uniref:Secreted protein n=1 Tax=Cyclopterus lumpus TaxID=8103 RepID=A0A8C3AVD5_CYCLU
MNQKTTTVCPTSHVLMCVLVFSCESWCSHVSFMSLTPHVSIQLAKPSCCTGFYKSFQTFLVYRSLQKLPNLPGVPVSTEASKPSWCTGLYRSFQTFQVYQSLHKLLNLPGVPVSTEASKPSWCTGLYRSF